MLNTSLTPQSDGKNAGTPSAFPDNPYRFETDWDIEAGQPQAKCIGFKVVEKHTRLKYGTTETEQVDFVTFLFEITSGKHAGKKIASNLFAVSMFKKSNLFGFLCDWLGRTPEAEFDPNSFQDMVATITIECIPGKKNPEISFARISRIAPERDSQDSKKGLA